MRRGLVLVGLVVLVAGPGAAPAAPASGIAGRTVAGPTCPVETVPPQPGCAPRGLAATLRVRRVGSRAPATALHSGAEGRFRIVLPPATYVLQPLPRGRSSYPRPPTARRVEVHAHRFTYVTIAYDTGIR
jgi:hypothetical protein